MHYILYCGHFTVTTLLFIPSPRQATSFDTFRNCRASCVRCADSPLPCLVWGVGLAPLGSRAAAGTRGASLSFIDAVYV